MAINQVALSGNVTRNPETRQTTAGHAVLTFGPAVNERRRNASGTWEDVPNYFEIVVYGQRAQALSQIITKGMPLTIGGKLRWSGWNDGDGARRQRVDVVADDVVLPPRR